MGYEEIEAAKRVLTDSTTDFHDYVTGIHELQDIVDYLALHEEAVISVRTWHEGRAFVVPNPDKEHNIARRTVTHYIFSANLLTEYLSTQLLARAFEPAIHEEKLPGPLENMKQYERENLLVQFDLISDSEKDHISGLRKTRNKFGHERDATLDLSTLNNPTKRIINYYRGVCVLIEELYGDPLGDIEAVVNQCFRYPHTTDLDEWSDGQVAQHYHRSSFGLLEKYGPLDEDSQKRLESSIRDVIEEISLLEREIEQRGYDPDTVLNTPIEHSPIKKQIMQDQPGAGSLVSGINKKIPEKAGVDESIDFKAEFELDVENNNPYTTVDTDEIEWYGVLFIDGRVLETYPTEATGEINPPKSAADESLQIQITTAFNETGGYNVQVGIIVETDDKVITGKTTEQRLDIISKTPSISPGDLLERYEDQLRDTD